MKVLRIKLIVTGDLERLALHESLRRCFPDVRDRQPVTWEQPRRLPCTTSHRLNPDLPPSAPMKALARAMLDEVAIGKQGRPADLVLVIDDVELGNLDHEEVVGSHFRAAVEAELAMTGRVRLPEVDLRFRLRNCCSFHMMRPMIEGYFFGDAAALDRAGVPGSATPSLVHPTDVERFEASDLRWLPRCRAENDRRQAKMPWWRHECHPKCYLEFLTDSGEVSYQETRQGRDALETLRWPVIPKVPTDDRFLRCLFTDLADWFGVQNPLGVGICHPDFYPPREVRRNRLLLRNM